jgi:NSS family neurotransmitter:Na+ symporter
MTNQVQNSNRESWATRIGLILAMAGNAIGLGNFLRFPVKAAQNGGGAFMIPYFAALLLLGIPLMWVEWTIGRYGGQYVYGTTAGAFGVLTKSRRSSVFVNFLGSIGIAVPLCFAIYYLYIESWTLAYSFFSVTGKYFGILDFNNMANFLGSFQGKLNSEYFSGFAIALVFFFITLGLNIYVLSRGIASGVERLVKIALSMLFVFAWIFDMKKGWNEINTGADIKIPVIFKYIIKFITPIYLIGLLIFWTYQDGISVFWM